MLLLLQISFCFVIRDTPCCLFLTIIKLMLLKGLTLPDDLLNIDNSYFEQMVGQTYPTELQFNKVNSFDAKAPVLDLRMA